MDEKKIRGCPALILSTKGYYDRPSREESLKILFICLFSLVGGIMTWMLGRGIEHFFRLGDWISFVASFLGAGIGFLLFCVFASNTPSD